MGVPHRAPARAASFGCPNPCSARRPTAGAPPRFTHPPPHLPPRAISSPKVTRRFCRLPLAIFWDLAKESSSRRPAAVMRTATKHLEGKGVAPFARRPASFPGRRSQASTAQKGAPLAAGQRRASPIKSIPHVASVDETPQTEQKTLRMRLPLGLAALLVTEPIVQWCGNLNPLPFRTGACPGLPPAPRPLFALRTDSPAADCPSRGTVLLLSPDGSHVSFNYSYQDLH